MTVYNATQHDASLTQIEAGIRDLDHDTALEVRALSTFKGIPSGEFLVSNAELVATKLEKAGVKTAMIGGAPFFMAHLERALFDKEIQPVYAFSDRVSTEQVQEDGTIRKVSEFKHMGLINAVQ